MTHLLKNHSFDWSDFRFPKAILFSDLFSTLFFGTLAISLIRQFYFSSQVSQPASNSVFKLLKLIAVIGLIGFFIAFLFHSIVFIIVLAQHSQHIFDNAIFNHFYFYFFNVCYRISWSLLYTFMLIRIRYTFMNTVYALSDQILYVHFICICIYSPILIIFEGLCIRSVLPYETYTVCGILYILITIIGSIHLMYTFIHNLWLSVVSQLEQFEQLENDSINDMDIVKHCVLGAMILGNLSISAILITINTPLIHHFEFGSFFEIFGVRVFMVYFGAVLIMFCALALYLDFAVNNKLYFKLCNKCNNCMTFKRMNIYSQLRDGNEKEINM